MLNAHKQIEHMNMLNSCDSCEGETDVRIFSLGEWIKGWDAPQDERDGNIEYTWVVISDANNEPIQKPNLDNSIIETHNLNLIIYIYAIDFINYGVLPMPRVMSSYASI